MTVCFRRSFVLSAGVALAIGFSGAASAFEAEDVAGRLAETLSKSGYDISWASSSVNGDAIVLEGVKAGMIGMDEQVALGAIVMNGVAEAGDGAYTVDNVSLSDYMIEEDGFKVAISGASLSGLVLPAEGAEKTLRSIIPYTGMALASVNVAGPDGEIFNMANLDATMNIPDDGSQASYTSTVESFTVNSASFPEAEARAAFAALGYSTLEGSMDANGLWNPEDGRMTIDKMAIAVNDAGILDFNMDIAGYTVEFIESLQSMQKKMMEEGEDESTGIAMLGLMQQITFNSAKIRFDDNSLTYKIMDFVAAQQGMKRTDIANQAKAILPFALAQLNNPDFTAQITSAVSAFLDDPQSIQVSAEPGTPLPIAMLIAGGMSAPENLPNQLGVKVTANQ